MTLYPLGKVSAFVPPRKCLGLRPRHFLGSTQALTFPAGYNGSYIPLARDITYTYTIQITGSKGLYCGEQSLVIQEATAGIGSRGLYCNPATTRCCGVYCTIQITGSKGLYCSEQSLVIQWQQAGIAVSNLFNCRVLGLVLHHRNYWQYGLVLQ